VSFSITAHIEVEQDRAPSVCHITQNWRGRPLTNRLAVVELIAATTTKTGLKVESALDTRSYEKGIKISKAMNGKIARRQK
jgi:Rhodopirellula transposase DDE domain